MSCYGPSVSDIRRPIREVTRHLPLLALLAAPLCGLAQAMNYEVGTSLICDTQTQVERFVALFPAKPHRLRVDQRSLSAGGENGMARNGDSAL
jgi:hypothetical protein